MKSYLRTWKQYTIEEVEKSLLLIGLGSVICFSCKHIGTFDAIEADFICPSCKAVYRFFGFKNTELDVRYIERVLAVKPDAVFIDLNDFQKEFNKKKAKDIFS